MKHSASHSHEHIVVRFKYDWMNQIWERKIPFLAVFLVISTVTYGALFAIDFYPELTIKSDIASEWDIKDTASNGEVRMVQPPVSASTTSPNSPPKKTESMAVSGTNAQPLRIIIEALDRDVKVLNPQETSIAALDAALLEGVIRHPDSADFKKTGTMFLLGHSSYLPTVRNRNFQAFNGLGKLVWGDVIRIQSADTEYLYRVQKVYEAKASNAEADIQWATPKLIMVTCNTFGAKDDRFVVEANFVQSYPIGSKSSSN